jgi:uncharacterized membrane protein YfcA
MNIALVFLLFAAAFVASLFGLGGGVLYTPFQLWLGVPFQQAAATSLLLILVTSFSATIVYRHSHRVDWTLALVLEIPTTLGAFIGGLLSHWLSVQLLTALLSGLLIISAYLMIYPLHRKFHSCAREARPFPSYWFLKRSWEGKTIWLDLRCVFPIMFILGALLSAVGISGGVVKVPLMVLLFRVPISIAVGSSAFMVGLTASAGFLGHATAGHVHWQTALLLALPVFIGAHFGSHLSVHLNSQKFKKLYAAFLIVISLVTFARIF